MPQGGMTHPRITQHIGMWVKSPCLVVKSPQLYTYFALQMSCNCMYTYTAVISLSIFTVNVCQSIFVSNLPTVSLSSLLSCSPLFKSLFPLFSSLILSYLNYWVFPYPSIRCSLQVSSNNLIHRILSILVLCYHTLIIPHLSCSRPEQNHLEGLSETPKPQRKGLTGPRKWRERNW